jgi:hypothetical protein
LKTIRFLRCLRAMPLNKKKNPHQYPHQKRNTGLVAYIDSLQLLLLLNIATAMKATA